MITNARHRFCSAVRNLDFSIGFIADLEKRQQYSCLRAELCSVRVFGRYCQRSEQWSWWSPAGWAKLTVRASSWLYLSKFRYNVGIWKVMKTQQLSSQCSALLACYWFSIMSPICCSNPIVSGDWSKAEQRGTCSICCICVLVPLWIPLSHVVVTLNGGNSPLSLLQRLNSNHTTWFIYLPCKQNV